MSEAVNTQIETDNDDSERGLCPIIYQHHLTRDVLENRL